MLEAAACSTLIPYVNWVSVGKEYSLQIEFSSWRKAQFLPNRSIQLSWRNSWISPKKLFMLEAAASCRLIPCENWVSFWHEFFLQIIVFMVEKGSCGPK
jgi:hypothetical protein